MADPDDIGQRELSGLGVTVLDELIALLSEHRELGEAPMGVQDAKLVVLVEHYGCSVGAAVDTHARPRGQFVGYLVGERGDVDHGHDPTKRVEPVSS